MSRDSPSRSCPGTSPQDWTSRSSPEEKKEVKSGPIKFVSKKSTSNDRWISINDKRIELRQQDEEEGNEESPVTKS